MSAGSVKTLIDAFQAAANADTGKFKPIFKGLNKKFRKLINKVEIANASKSDEASVGKFIAWGEFVCSFHRLERRAKDDTAAKPVYEDLSAKLNRAKRNNLYGLL